MCTLITSNPSLQNTKLCADLENEVKVTNLYSTFHTVIVMYLIKFDLNPSIGSEDRVHEAFFQFKFGNHCSVTLKMKSRHQNLINT